MHSLVASTDKQSGSFADSHAGDAFLANCSLEYHLSCLWSASVLRVEQHSKKESNCIE